MKNWLILIALLHLLFPIPALARPGTIDVDVGDVPMEISGWLEEENAFTDNIRLTANGSDVEDFLFIASDLKRDGDYQVIGRQNVAIVGDLNLKKGVPKNYLITISNVKDPGTYRGWIKFLLPDKDKFKILNLTLIAKSRPKLVPLPGSDKIELKLVNSDNWFAKLVLPAAAFTNHWEIQMDNPTMVDVNVTSSDIAVTGDNTGYQLNSSDIAMTGETKGYLITNKYLLPRDIKTFPSNSISDLNLILNRKKIPADSYSGNIYLTMDGGKERLMIPITISMRIGALWAVGALFLGIILGMLFRYAQKKEPQSKALREVYRTEALIQDAYGEDRQKLQDMIDEVRNNVYREKLEKVQADLQAIENRLKSLKELRNMESNLEKMGLSQDMKDQYLATIAEARGLLVNKRDAEASEKIKELNIPFRSKLMGKDTPNEIVLAISSTGKAAEFARRASEAQQRSTEAAPEPIGLSDRIKGWLTYFSNHFEQVSAETAFWVLPQIVKIAILLVFLAIGFQSLYIEKGLTFGANPFVDYMTLILWGISADVALSGLGGLLGKKENSA